MKRAKNILLVLSILILVISIGIYIFRTPVNQEDLNYFGDKFSGDYLWLHPENSNIEKFYLVKRYTGTLVDYKIDIAGITDPDVVSEDDYYVVLEDNHEKRSEKIIIPKADKDTVFYNAIYSGDGEGYEANPQAAGSVLGSFSLGKRITIFLTEDKAYNTNLRYIILFNK